MLLKTKTIIEFGDFQTPGELANQVVSFVADLFSGYKTLVEPTCGYGSFLEAALQCDALNEIKTMIGWDINHDYIDIAQNISRKYRSVKYHVSQQDFFQVDWTQLRSDLDEPVLFLGNPPWVTNSEIGKITGQNLPEKINFRKHAGMDAMTGKSNFDISEWMMIQIANFISSTRSAMAFLIKSSVARKVFSYIVSNQLQISDMQIRSIDAKRFFNVHVDACLFYAKGNAQEQTARSCPVYPSLTNEKPARIMGQTGKQVIANLQQYVLYQDLDTGSPFPWRSGIKHDCASVMELRRYNGYYENGFYEQVTGMEDYLYPMYKSSDIAKTPLRACHKYMLVTQKHIGEPTHELGSLSPETWNYLTQYSSLLDTRKSSIYRNAPRFSIFGVGDYTFKPWKVAISGLYKTIHFSLIPPYDGKPVVLDDTCYFLGFDTREQAELIHQLVSSNTVRRFIESIVFLDDKRPITASLLNRINLEKAAKNENLSHCYQRLIKMPGDQQHFCFS
jgi:hypothetical protein